MKSYCFFQSLLSFAAFVKSDDLINKTVNDKAPELSIMVVFCQTFCKIVILSTGKLY